MGLRQWLSLLGLAGLLLGSEAMATEEPVFQTVLQDGDFEIRDYPAVTIAEVTVDGDQSTAGNRGFRLLAGYIFGGNKEGRSIAMTAPVAMEPDRSGWIVRFFMPDGMTPDSLPVPDESRITLRQLDPARMAVLRFSGWANGSDLAEKGAALLSWVTARGLTAQGQPVLAQYNPPWTLWFARRNEVMVAVSREPAQ